jgi:hypothetical protein
VPRLRSLFKVTLEHAPGERLHDPGGADRGGDHRHYRGHRHGQLPQRPPTNETEANDDTKAYNAAAVTFNMPPSTITYGELTTLLAPTYMRNIPRTDGWGLALDFALDQPIGGPQASTYAIRSPGRDGQFSGNSYNAGPTTEFDCDIVYSGGAFIVWPEGTQTH